MVFPRDQSVKFSFLPSAFVLFGTVDFLAFACAPNCLLPENPEGQDQVSRKSSAKWVKKMLYFFNLLIYKFITYATVDLPYTPPMQPGRFCM